MILFGGAVSQDGEREATWTYSRRPPNKIIDGDTVPHEKLIILLFTIIIR